MKCVKKKPVLPFWFRPGLKNTGDQNIFKKKHLSVRSDLNRNVVHMSSTHLPSSGSEADHEEDASDEELDV